MPRFVGTFMLPDAGLIWPDAQERVHRALKHAASGDPQELAPYPDATENAPKADVLTDTVRFHIAFNAPDRDTAVQRLTEAVAFYPAAVDVRVSDDA